MFSESSKLKLVKETLLKLQIPKDSDRVELKRTRNNSLLSLRRHEIIEILNKILKKEGPLFTIEPSNRYKKILDITYDEKSKLPLIHAELMPEEEKPIFLYIEDSFTNWIASIQHKNEITLEKLSEPNLEKIIEITNALYDKFQLTSNPEISLPCIKSHPTRNHEVMREVTKFLMNKHVIRKVWSIASGAGFISVEIVIRISELEKFKRQLDCFLEKNLCSQAQINLPKKIICPIQIQKWGDITMQFIDGHDIKISIGEKSITLSYEEMGFKDGRTRKPNMQWRLLQKLADHRGIIDWETPEAHHDIKKGKQLLSKTLKYYFQLNQDPFYPYKERKAYQLKFTLSPEK